jgi:hypothetical protein
MWKNNDDAGAEPFRGSITAYREAVEEFSTNASEFLKCIPMLVKTREAYQRSMSISSEMRQILDTGDETLQKMMRQIEQAVNVQLGSQPEKKKPEVVKAEAAKPMQDTGTGTNLFTVRATEKRMNED